MTSETRIRERLVAIFLLGLLLLLPPVLLVFNRPDRLLGVPVLYLYVFLAWIALIVLSAAVARSIPVDRPAGDGEAQPDLAGRANEARRHA